MMNVNVDLEIPFHYRFYKKKSKFICLRSLDGERHFTLVHIRDQDRKEFNNSEWNKINYQIKKYLEEHEWKLIFTPYQACRNCTYGYFEPEFESLIESIRKQYNTKDKEIISTEHDIPNYDADYVKEFGKAGNMWAHMSHSRGSNEKLCEFLQTADKNTKLVLNITVRTKRTD